MRKSRPQVLEEFIKHLFKRDPMGLCDPSNPDAATEYDGEALSILSRFVEAHLVGMARKDALHIAYVVVQSAFTFWVNSPLQDEKKAKKLSRELLDLFLSAYPEQKSEPEVGSAT